jgi:hypothetical protein
VVLSANNTNAMVILDGSLSSDVENDPLQFRWFADDGLVPLASGVLVSNRFEVGTHTIILVVDDGHDSGTATLTVDVVRPAMAVEELSLMLSDSSLERQRLRPLLATLKAVTAAFERGSFTAGVNQLKALQNKIRAQIAPGDPALANSLIQAAQRIIDVMSRH